MKKNMLIMGMLGLGLTVLTVQSIDGPKALNGEVNVVPASGVVESFLSQRVPSYGPEENFMEAIALDKYSKILMDLQKSVQKTPLSEPAFFIRSEEERDKLLKDISNARSQAFGTR